MRRGSRNEAKAIVNHDCDWSHLYTPHAARGYLLDYSDKNIRNDVHQIILYDKSQFNSPVWGSLTFAPNITLFIDILGLRI